MTPALRLATTLTLTLAATAPCQVHTRTALVLGQPASLSLSAAPAGSFALFGITASGLGSGTCFPAPFSVCLDVLEPVAYLPAVAVDSAGRATLQLVLPAGLPQIPIASQALVIDAGGAVPAVGKSNAIEDSIQPLSAWSDDFDGSQLDASWRIYNGALLSYSVSGGELHLHPTQSGPPVTWYADGEGPLVYKLVRGDFDVRTSVRVYDSTDPSQPPPISFRMGGISLRDPSAAPGQHNWLHVAVGGGTATVPIAVEDKTTVNSSSNLRLTPLAAPRAEVRATRQGSTVTFYYRETAAAAWTPLRSFVRTDLPPAIQVGLMVYSWQAPNHVQVSYDDFSIANL